MPKVVTLVLRDDHPAGVVVGNRDNWTGKALGFAVTDLSRVRPELDRAGVYVLTGTADLESGEEGVVYIGEAESLATRLSPTHHQMLARDDVTWHRVVVFLSQAEDLHKAHVKWLEAKLVQRARATSQTRLLNGGSPSILGLPEQDVVFAEAFLENMLALYPVLGVHAFTSPDAAQAPGVPIAPQSSSPGAPATRTIESNPLDAGELVLRRSGQVIARGRRSRVGFTLLEGSAIARVGTGSEGPNVIRVRELLRENGLLDDLDADNYRLRDDHDMTSPSAAAKLVVGSSVSGNVAWRPS